MFCTFLVMAAIEISLLIDKPGARVFAGSVVAVGLVLHWISVARKRRQPAAPTPEQAILTLEDRNRTWKNDREASALFTYVKKKADGQPVLPCYAVSDVPAHTLVDLAVKIGATLLILGAPRRHMLVKLIRGNMVRRVSRFLPQEIHLLVYA
jgi:nucleotide-binding universal stress UspA family protein